MYARDFVVTFAYVVLIGILYGQGNSENTTLTTTGTTTPHTGSTSPNTGSTSPNTGSTSPNTGSTSPNTGSTSPNTGSTSPNTGSTSPNTGSTTTLNPNASTTTPAPGPIPFGSGLGYWELTNLTEQLLCVPGRPVTFDNCVNLVKEIPSPHFHSWDNLTGMTPGKCVYLTDGPFNDTRNAANKTDIKRCMITARYTPRENLSSTDDVRWHFFNGENNVTLPIFVVGYWNKRHEPVDCVETPM